MNKEILRAVFVSSAVAIAAFGCKQAPPPQNNIGTVDGEPISSDEFYATLEHLPQVEVRAPQGAPISLRVAQPLGDQAIQNLVQQRLILSLAKDEGVLPTAADIDKEIDYEKARNPQFVSALTDQGYSLDQIRHIVQVDLARERIITKGIVITPDEAKAYINKNKDRFSTPPMAKLLVVIVKDEKTKTEVDQALAKGQQFSEVTMKYSSDPAVKQTGGVWPATNVKQLGPPLEGMVEKTPVQKTTPWIQNRGEWFKFYVQDKSPAKLQPVNDQLLETVERFLAMQKGNQTSDFGKKIVDKVKSANVNISNPAYKDSWATFVKGLTMNAQPPAPTPAPPAKSGTTPKSAGTGTPAPSAPPKH
ncbi:MAG TPA: peptidyl-prolyl cis-trans isomerase [Fimbriimonas sp.]|nr:peptidyl-prolyl cis-trans isomerase [Fimbriimonas sp.]